MTNPNSMQAMREKIEPHHMGALRRAVARLDAEVQQYRNSDPMNYDVQFPECDAKSLREVFSMLSAPQPSPDDASAQPYEIHSCSPFCERPECVKDRELEQLRRQLHDASARLEAAYRADELLRQNCHDAVVCSDGFINSSRVIEILNQYGPHAAIAAQAGKAQQ